MLETPLLQLTTEPTERKKGVDRETLFYWMRRIAAIATEIETKTLGIIGDCSQPPFIFREIERHQRLDHEGKFRLHIGVVSYVYKLLQDISEPTAERIVYGWNNTDGGTYTEILPTDAVIYEQNTDGPGLGMEACYAKGKLVKFEIKNSRVTGENLKELLVFLGIDLGDDLERYSAKNIYYLKALCNPDKVRIHLHSLGEKKHTNFETEDQTHIEGPYTDLSGLAVDSSKGTYVAIKNYILSSLIELTEYSLGLLEGVVNYGKILERINLLRDLNIPPNFMHSDIEVSYNKFGLSLIVSGTFYVTFIDFYPEDEILKVKFTSRDHKDLTSLTYKKGKIDSLVLSLDNKQDIEAVLKGSGISINYDLTSAVEALLATGFRELTLTVWPGKNNSLGLNARKTFIRDEECIDFMFQDGKVVKYDVDINTSNIDLIARLIKVIDPSVTMAELRKTIEMEEESGKVLKGLSVEGGNHRFFNSWRCKFKYPKDEKKNGDETITIVSG